MKRDAQPEEIAPA